MPVIRVTACSLLILLSSICVAAQSTVIHPAQSTIPGVTPRTTKPRQEPCYQVAGVSKAAIEQRKSIAESAKSQIESVCANASLTPQQRSQEIKQIHQQEMSQINAIITPQQQEAMRSCNQARRPAGSVPQTGVRHGPCGEVLGSAQPMPHPQPGSPQPGTGTQPPTGQPANPNPSSNEPQQ